MRSKSKLFRKYLSERKGSIVRPCAFDTLSAILIEKASFEVVGTTGYGIAATLIGH